MRPFALTGMTDTQCETPKRHCMATINKCTARICWLHWKKEGRTRFVPKQRKLVFMTQLNEDCSLSDSRRWTLLNLLVLRMGTRKVRAGFIC